MWQLEWGDSLDFLEALEEEDPLNPPPALEERPWLEERVAWILSAFFLLGRGRRVGFGPGGIPLADVEAYCRLAQVYDRCQFARHIHALDTAYLKWAAERAAKK